MTDREFAYKRLTENQIKSGDIIFIFEHPQNYPLSTFNILENNIGKFEGTYSINEKDNQIIVRISTVSGNKRLSFVSDKTYEKVLVGLNYLESPLEDFVKLLINEIWFVN